MKGIKNPPANIYRGIFQLGVILQQPSEGKQTKNSYISNSSFRVEIQNDKNFPHFIKSGRDQLL